MKIEKFIEQKENEIDKNCYKYDWWYIVEDNWEFVIAYSQVWASESFSIWQQVFDKEWNLMWYLWIALYNHLDYGRDIRVPYEKWVICLPTEYCKEWKEVVGYRQKYFQQLGNS